MKKLIKFLISKTFILGILLLAQFIFAFWVLDKLIKDQTIGIYVHSFFQILSIFIVLYIIASDENPTYKMAWLIPVLALPVFGTFFYIFYYSNNVGKRRKSLYLDIIKNRYDLLMEHPKYIDTKEIRYFNHNGWRDYKNTISNFYPSGEQKLEALLNDLNKAEKFIFLEYFIFAKGEMFDQIMDVVKLKASQGVIVKIIFDDMGTSDRIPSGFIKKMGKLNIEVVRFNKMSLHLNFALNYRDHRKIVVIDNKVAYTGGVNIGDEYINKVQKFGNWTDCALRIEGQAVWSMTLIFLENWNFTSKNKLNFKDFYYPHEVKSDAIYVPFGDNPLEDEQVARNLYLYIIGQAKKEILITTPYLILDNEIVTALKLAAQSGVDVKIVIPGIPDKKLVYLVTKSFAHDLFNVGVNIYQYTPGFVHSKLVVVDGHKALVGTTNLDFRSLYLNFENNIFMQDSSSIQDVRNYILELLDASNLCDKSDLYKRGLIRNVIITSLKGFGAIL